MFRNSSKLSGMAAAFVILLAALGLAGCGGDNNAATNDLSAAAPGSAAGRVSTIPEPTGAAGGMEDIDPCDLVAKADATTILGEAVDDHRHLAVDRGERCLYATMKQPPRQLDMTVIKPCSMADYANMGKGDPVRDLGMHAAWDKDTLYVHTMANACLIISGDQLPLDSARTAAQMLIDKMVSGANGGSRGT